MDSDCKQFLFTLQLFVRLDLFLKSSRLIKRRTLARQMCDDNLVQVNGQHAKPAKEIRPGDVITLRFSSRILELDVTALPVANRKASPEPPYIIRSDIRVSKDDQAWNESPL